MSSAALSCRDLRIQRASGFVLEIPRLELQPGSLTALCGPNGSGKSSLLELALGRVDADRGEVSVPAGLTIAHVAQESPHNPGSALDYVMDGDRELRQVQAEIAEKERRLQEYGTSKDLFVLRDDALYAMGSTHPSQNTSVI